MGKPPDAVSDERLETDGKTDTESVVPTGKPCDIVLCLFCTCFKDSRD